MSTDSRIPLDVDVNLDPIGENIWAFRQDGDKSVADHQLVSNTGYHFNDGVSSLHQNQYSDQNNPVYSFTTEGGNLIELIPNGNDATSGAPINGVYLDGRFMDNVPSHGLQSVQAISGNYDDLLLTDGNTIGMKIIQNANNIPVFGTGGTTWTARTSTAASGNGWYLVAYGNGLFVVIATNTSSTTGVIQTSPDGINWTARTSTSSAALSGWYSVTYGNGLFVAVANTTSTTGAVQTSPDGINWTARTSTAASGGGWVSITYGNGLFVAVANTTSITGAVQTSPDGINWTARTSTAASGNKWYSVTYGNGLFVAVANTTSTTGAVQTSPDGINWTARTSTASSSGWYSVTYGNGLFVAVSATISTTGAVQTSPDGINWTARTSTAASGGGWVSITYGNGLFVAVANTTSITGAVQTSPDGINWTARTSTAASGNGWFSVTYGNGFFIAVAETTSTTGAIQTSPITLSGQSVVRLDEIDSSGTIVNTVTRTILNSGFSRPIALIKQSLSNSFTWASTQYFLAADSTTTYNIFDQAGVAQLTTSIPVAWANGAPKYIWAAKFVSKNDYAICALGAVGSGANPSSYMITSTGGSAPFTNTNTGLTFSWAVMQSKNGFNRVMFSGQTNPAGTSGQHLVFYGYNSLTSSYTSAPAGNTISNSTDLAAQPASSSYAYCDIVHTDYAHYYSGYLTPTSANYSSGTTPFTTTANSSGPVNGFGRLSFVDAADFGQNPQLEFRLNMVKTGTYAAAPQFISVANPYSVSGYTSIGVPISTFGEFDPSWGPQIGASWTSVAWRWGSIYYVAIIGTQPIKPIQKITTNLYKINTISSVNVVNISQKSLVLGSNDYTSSFLISGGTNSGTTWGSTNIQWSNTYDNAANSIDVGGEFFFNTGSYTVQPLGCFLPALNQTLNYYNVSEFAGTGATANTLNQVWRADGQLLTGTQLLTGFQNQVAALSTTYISNTSLIPIPLGSRFSGYTIGTNSSATSLAFNETYVSSGFQGVVLTSEWDGYISGNQIQLNAVSFALFNQPYLFDGKNIYRITVNNGGVSLPLTVLCRADGLVYMTTSPQMAFFFDSFDNSIWAFDGGYTLKKVKRLDGIGSIQNGNYSVYDTALTVNTTNSIAVLRDGIWINIPKIAAMVPDNIESAMRLYDTTTGTQFGNTFNWWKYQYYSPDTIGQTTTNGIIKTSSIVPFAFQTGYIGPDNNERMVLDSVTFGVYSETKSLTSITITILGYDQDKFYSLPTKTFVLNPGDFNTVGIWRGKIQAQTQRYLGASFRIDCTTQIRLFDLQYHWTDEAQAIYKGSHQS